MDTSETPAPPAPANAPFGRGAVTATLVIVAGLVFTLGVMAVGRANGGSPAKTTAKASVSKTCVVPALPGTVVTVYLSDMANGGVMGGMAGGGHLLMTSTPATVPAGQVSFLTRNTGGLPHELVILTLPAGDVGARASGSDGKVDEATSVGESSKPCAEGPGDGLTAGTEGWVTVTLAPGHYELVCDEPGHYAAGMYTLLTVQ